MGSTFTLGWFVLFSSANTCYSNDLRRVSVVNLRSAQCDTSSTSCVTVLEVVLVVILVFVVGPILFVRFGLFS